MSPSRPVGTAPEVPTREQLLAWACRHLGPADLLGPDGTTKLLALVPGWHADGDAIARDYRLRDFRVAVDFAGAIAGFADEQDHHPELTLGYGRCRVRWSTHSAGGITMNDFACAALTDAAFERLAR